MLLFNIVLVNIVDGMEDCLVVLKDEVDREEIILLVDVVLILSAITDADKLNSLLNITLVDVTDDVDINALLDNVFIEATDNAEDGSLLNIEPFNVADGTEVILLLETVLVEEINDGGEISVLLEATLVTVIDVAEVISALLDITLVDVRNKEGAVSNGADNVLVDAKLVNTTDVEEYCSLCDLALVGKIGIVVFIALSVTVLEETTVSIELG